MKHNVSHVFIIVQRLTQPSKSVLFDLRCTRENKMPDILSKYKGSLSIYLFQVFELAVPAIVLIVDTKGSEYTINNQYVEIQLLLLRLSTEERIYLTGYRKSLILNKALS
jgi:hypothetical protein